MDHDTGITIRPVNEQDLLALFRVYQQCQDFLALGPEPTASLEMVKSDMEMSRQEGGIFCGIYQDGEVIGVVDYVPDGFEGIADEGFISLLMIAAPYRHQGVGASVVNQVEQLCRKRQVTVLSTAVQINNPQALRFWQRLGYHIITDPELRPDGTTVYQLRYFTRLTRSHSSQIGPRRTSR